MSKFVLYGKPSAYDQLRDRQNKPHAFFYFQAEPSRYEAVVNVESRVGGEPANDMLFRVLVSDETLMLPEGALYRDDVEVANRRRSAVVDALLQQVRAEAADADEPNLQWFDNQFNYQQLWTDQDIVANWRTHPHQGNDGLFARLQSIYDNFINNSKRWYFIGKKFSRTGLDLVHMNAGVGSPDGLILIQVDDSKWVAVFFAFQVDFFAQGSAERTFRRHPPTNDIEITRVNYNPPGPDEGNESITLRNNRATDVNLKGWKITASRGSVDRRYILPPIILHANEELEIFVSEELFPNRGATVTLRDATDAIIAATEYF